MIKKFERQEKAQVRLNDNVHLLHETIPTRLGEVAVLCNVHKPTQRVETREITRIMFQAKEQDKTPGTELNEMEIIFYLIKSSK